MTSKQRRIDVDVTSWRRIDVDMALFTGRMPAGSVQRILITQLKMNVIK